MAGTVVIREYRQSYMAEAARGLLEQAGIEALIASDDAGGLYPQINFTSGYRVLVPREELEKAEEVLEVLGDYEKPEGFGLFS